MYASGEPVAIELKNEPGDRGNPAAFETRLAFAGWRMWQVQNWRLYGTSNTYYVFGPGD
jgi:hypothetical protein